MAVIYLKYAAWNGSTWIWSSSYSFNCLHLTKVRVPLGISGRTERQVDYSHKLGYKFKWTVIIGSNVLYLDSEYTKIENFWTAERWKLSEDNWSSEYEVTRPDEDLPVEYPFGHKKLRKVTMELIQKEKN